MAVSKLLIRGLRSGNGPAIELENGDKNWYLWGARYTINDWLRCTPSLTEEEKVMMKLQYG
jgi:hypothetical protein